MALGHERLDVYRLAAMLSRLGKRGYSVQEEPASYGIDSDFDSDEIKSKPDAALNADKPREWARRSAQLRGACARLPTTQSAHRAAVMQV